MADDPFVVMVEGLKSEGLSTVRICREAGVSRQSIYRYLVGESKKPSYETYSRLALLSRSYGLPVPQPSRRR